MVADEVLHVHVQESELIDEAAEARLPRHSRLPPPWVEGIVLERVLRPWVDVACGQQDPSVRRDAVRHPQRVPDLADHLGSREALALVDLNVDCGELPDLAEDPADNAVKVG